MDYDSLFNRDNYKYKNCRLRYKLISRENTNINPVSGAGVIAVNGLASPYVSKNTHMLPLDIVTPIIRAFANGATTGTISGSAPIQTTGASNQIDIYTFIDISNTIFGNAVQAF